MEPSELSEREQKQKYLRDHVSPDLYEDFAQFCTSYTGSLDIDGWTLSYVQELVQKFYQDRKNEVQERSFAHYQSSTADVIAFTISAILKQKKPKGSAVDLLDEAFNEYDQEEKAKLEKSEQSKSDPTLQNTELSEKSFPTFPHLAYEPKIPYQGTTIIKDAFHDKVKCVKSAVRATLNLPGFGIFINDFQVIHRNFFVADYIMYHVKVEPSGHICKRNYEDFYKLKASLSKKYPGIQLPYLQKDSWLSDTSEQFAKVQSRNLQFFLRDILSNKNLRNSRIVEDFLTLPDHKKIKRKFEEYQKMEELKSIQELCLLEGEVQVQLTQNHRIYGQKMTKFIEKMGYNFDKYRKNCETLSSQYASMINTIATLNSLMTQMQEDVIDFNKRVNINEVNQLDISFKTLGSTYQEQFDRLTFQKRILDDGLLPFIKYQISNINNCKEIVEQCTYMTNRYLKREELEGQPPKNIAYLNKIYEQFKGGVMEESKNLTVFQYQVGYINSQMTGECERIFESLAHKINQKLKRVSENYRNQFEKSAKFWEAIN